MSSPAPSRSRTANSMSLSLLFSLHRSCMRGMLYAASPIPFSPRIVHRLVATSPESVRPALRRQHVDVPALCSHLGWLLLHHLTHLPDGWRGRNVDWIFLLQPPRHRIIQRSLGHGRLSDGFIRFIDSRAIENEYEIGC